MRTVNSRGVIVAPMAIMVAAVVLFGVAFYFSLFASRGKNQSACVSTQTAEDLTQPREPDESCVLTLLNKDGKNFYAQSKAIRATYPASHPYKKFLLIGFSLSQIDREGYFHPSAGNN